MSSPGLVRRASSPRSQPAGQPEVHDDGFAAAVEHDVARLEVAMNDPLLMRLVQGEGDLADQLQHHGDGPVGRRGPIVQRLALDVGHGQIGGVADGADVVDGADVGVVEGGSGPGLAVKALVQRGGVAGPQLRHLQAPPGGRGRCPGRGKRIPCPPCRAGGGWCTGRRGQEVRFPPRRDEGRGIARWGRSVRSAGAWRRSGSGGDCLSLGRVGVVMALAPARIAWSVQDNGARRIREMPPLFRLRRETDHRGVRARFRVENEANPLPIDHFPIGVMRMLLLSWPVTRDLPSGEKTTQ